MAGFTHKKQTIHDKLVHSVVTYKDPEKKNTRNIIISVVILLLLLWGCLTLWDEMKKEEKDTVQSYLNAIRLMAQSNQGRIGLYGDINDCSSGIFSAKKIQSYISELANENLKCYTRGNTFAISADLRNSNTSFCVDSENSYDDSVAVVGDMGASCQGINGTKKGKDPEGGFNISYTYTLPEGWEYGENINPFIHEAFRSGSHEIFKDVLGVSSVPLVKEEEIYSVTQLVDEERVREIIETEFPRAVVNSVNLTTFAGKEAYEAEFDEVVYGFLLRGRVHIVVHNQVLHSITFRTPEIKYSEDFDFIKDSFVFISN